MGRNEPTEEKNPIEPRDRRITFLRPTAFVVPYNEENINRCRCPECPVQAESRCALEKFQDLRQELENVPEGEVPNPENVPGVYCSEGKASCQDLNFERECICCICDVWKEYDIKDAHPNNHFCQYDRAT